VGQVYIIFVKKDANNEATSSIQTSHGNISFRELALVLVRGLVAVLALEQLLAIGVQVQLGDHNLGGVEAQHDGGTVVLLTRDALNVDDVLLAVHGGDLAIAVLESAAHDLHLIVLADGQRSHVVLLLELLGQRGRHNLAAQGGVSAEVLLAGLAARAVFGLVEFHPSN